MSVAILSFVYISKKWYFYVMHTMYNMEYMLCDHTIYSYHTIREHVCSTKMKANGQGKSFDIDLTHFLIKSDAALIIMSTE